MPYLMAGFPDMETSLQIGLACADNGADLVELGVPYSDPLADGPVIHAAGTAALRAGATFDGVLEVAAGLVAAPAGRAHVLREHRARAHARRLLRRREPRPASAA